MGAGGAYESTSVGLGEIVRVWPKMQSAVRV